MYKRLFNYLEQVLKAYGDVPNDVLDIELWLNEKDELIFEEI